jgi:hypothetical protein
MHRIGSYLTLAVLALATGCGGAASDSERGPLRLKRYELLELRPQDLEGAVRRGEPISLRFGDRQHTLLLKPRNLVAPGCTVVVLGSGKEPEPCPSDLGTYAGRLTDGTGWSHVRLSITPQAVIGTIWLSDELWTIAPVATPDPAPAGVVRHIIYRSKDILGSASFEKEAKREAAAMPAAPAHQGWGGEPEALNGGRNDPGGCDPQERRDCAPPGGHSGSSGGSTPPPRPLPSLSIALLADAEYIAGARFSPSVMAAQAAMLSSVDAMYRREGVASLSIGRVILDPTNTFFNSLSADALVNAVPVAATTAGLNLSIPTVRTATGITTAFLTSGKPPDGTTLGEAFQPGFAGMAFQDQSLVLDAATGSAKAWSNWVTVAHELGHNFSAMHEQADWFCRFWFIVCTNPAYTVMWPMLTHRTSPEFSDGFWDPSHNNFQMTTTNIATRP